MKAIVSRQELQAAMLFASVDDTRYVLNSVNIELKPKAQPLLVATDGRRLTVIETQAAQESEGASIETIARHNFSIPTQIVKVIVALSKTIGKKLFPLVELENAPGSKRLAARIVGREVWLGLDKDALIDGIYPDWRKVIPPKHIEREPVSEIGLSAEFAADYAKAGEALESESLALTMNLIGKNGAIEVKLGHLHYFYSLVMPVLIETDVNFQPDFLKQIAA